MHQTSLTFARFLHTKETRFALLAVQELAEYLSAKQSMLANPLFLYGPTGTGKTHLVSALVEEVRCKRPELALVHLTAGDFTQADFSSAHESPETNSPTSAFALARESEVLIVEDLQHLHGSAVGPFTQLVDDLLARGQPLIFTADAGPQQLRPGKANFPVRLLNRLAGGVVVGLHLPGEQSRLALLRECAQGLPLGEEVFFWLARHLTGGIRQLLGAVRQLELLAKAGQPLDLKVVAQQFQVQSANAPVTVESIVRQVSQYFQVEPKQLCSRQRFRHVLVPRQVGMYLARQCTELSLEQIGAYFGGRDHTTVLHACRKVEKALDSDMAISGAVRQLRTGLV